MELYTVIIQEARIVSSFDARGKKVGEETKMVEVTINALPYSTAQMYKSTDPHGTCKIIPYVRETSRSSRDKAPLKLTFGTSKTKGFGSTSKSKVVTAAERGDLAAAISS
ncbi:hypothetical protein [Phyllobacterium myrsinacearum]|uniref:Uncharacterized protein n=1 Tax=Phyllobacterium myrsinacearum TaxID=28101 RepID=A0A839EUK2_9HYPH|nr:hypothetical protein [Phyllobacterium myrsinacearum]MBA8881785.1 hypothetical protein [Phyllobacterium myrsinacearum]